MISTKVELKKEIVVEDPKLSLKQFARYPNSTIKGKQRILINSKYPGGYIPRYYEIARKVVVDIFSSNFRDYELYFSEFQRHASRLKKEALLFDPKTDDYKNRHCSAVALEQIINMREVLIPLLERYVLNDNLRNKRDNIFIKEVRIGAMSDMLIFDNLGNHVGLLKFNFTKSKLKESEAQITLHVLKAFFTNVKQITLQPKHCLFVDIYSAKIFNAERAIGIAGMAEVNCQEIKTQWPVILNPKEKTIL